MWIFLSIDFALLDSLNASTHLYNANYNESEEDEDDLHCDYLIFTWEMCRERLTVEILLKALLL